MSSRSLSRALLLSSVVTATLASTLPIAVAQAQTPPVPGEDPGPEPDDVPPIGGECGNGQTLQQAPIRPEKHAISPGGVDMRTGAYTYSREDLSIGGTGDGGLSLSRSFRWEDDARQTFGEFFSHNWDIRILESRVQICEANTIEDYDRQFTIAYGGLGTSFRSGWNGVSMRHISNDGHAKLTLSGNSQTGVYTFTARDGTRAVFRPMVLLGQPQDCAALNRCSFVSEVIRPDGTRFTLGYDTAPGGGSGRKRLRSVTSNRGYALLLEYNAPTPAGYNLVSKACVLNLAAAPKPANDVCPAGAPTATYAYSGQLLTSATDAGNSTYTVTTADGSTGIRNVAFYEPGLAAPQVRLTLGFDGNTYQALDQVFADGTSYAYDWNSLLSSGTAGGSYTNAAGKTVSLVYGEHRGPQGQSDPTLFITPGPERVIDELGRTTIGDYCVYLADGTCSTGTLQSWTDPEGAKRTFTYDSYRNPTQIVKTPKTGSTLANLIETAAFQCGSAVCSDKPTSKTDARGNTTTYTYDTTHGGVLTETAPADANGVQAVKRYSYAARHAWLSNDAGGHVPAATPVYLLSTERTCRTTATVNGACAGGAADEVVTTYDHGPNSGPNNLLPRGTVVTADGQSRRTCFGYDARGNRISETKPRAGLTVCQ